MKLSVKNGKPLYSTNQNSSLAKVLDLNLCRERCPEFGVLCDFLAQL